jgi:hypothetical protein
LKISSCFYCAASFLIFTRSLPAFVGATTSTIPLHSVSLRKLRSTAFQPYYVCRPLFFQRWRSSHSHRAWLRWHFALNQGTPKAVFIYFPRRFTLAVLLSTPYTTLRSRPAVAVRLPQPRHCAPRKIIISTNVTLIIFCGAWGCLIAVSIRTPQKTKQQHPSSKKKQKKKVKISFGFIKNTSSSPPGFRKNLHPRFVILNEVKCL